MSLADGKRSEGGGGRGRERRRFRRHSSHASPPSFFPASGYLLIGYSKISETRRYRRRKRGDAREDENRRKRERGWEAGKAEGCRKRGHRWEGCRGPYARVGVNYHYPLKTRLSFCSREFLFVSFPVAPDPTHPPSESFDSSARLCHPLTLSSTSSSFSSSSSSYHRPPKIRVRYYLSPDRSRSTTPANVLFRFLASRSYPSARHGRPTITGPRTI